VPDPEPEPVPDPPPVFPFAAAAVVGGGGGGASVVGTASVMGETDGESDGDATSPAAEATGTGLTGPTVGLAWSGDAQPAATTAATTTTSAFFHIRTCPGRSLGSFPGSERTDREHIDTSRFRPGS
jgi:hypothetical protein